MDIKFDSSGDIDVSTGDIGYVKADEQHKLTILLSRKGELKNAVDIGCGAVDFLLENNPGALLREARRQCQRVGMRITLVRFVDGVLQIKGGYDG